MACWKTFLSWLVMAILLFHNFESLCLLEEMAELQDALCKFKRGRRTAEDIAEEIADVGIMLDQAKLIFHVEEEVEAQRARKVARVEERLKK